MKQKAIVLLSGGLDSSLTLKLMKEQGIEIEALEFTSPFCLCDRCHAVKVAKDSGVKLNIIPKGKDYLEIVKKPRHGYGSGMNPCIDCRIHMFKKAWEFAKKKGAKFLVTGEVLGERTFSQRRGAMLLIEKEAGLEGKILRPLSAKLLPETEAERKGWVKREKLLAIQGRSRKPQIRLAKKFHMKDYPCPAGGCLLTDPGFSKRLRDFLKHNKKLTFLDIELLKIGRHFRLGKSKIVVGRNEQENNILLGLAEVHKLPYMEVKDYMGPVSVIQGRVTSDAIDRTARLTVRYSDSPGGKSVGLVFVKGKTRHNIKARAISERELEKIRI